MGSMHVIYTGRHRARSLRRGRELLQHLSLLFLLLHRVHLEPLAVQKLLPCVLEAASDIEFLELIRRLDRRCGAALEPRMLQRLGTVQALVGIGDEELPYKIFCWERRELEKYNE